MKKNISIFLSLLILNHSIDPGYTATDSGRRYACDSNDISAVITPTPDAII